MRIDKTIAKIASQTNSLPEGDYTFCIRLLTDAGEQVDGSDEACGDVSIVIADTPKLMFPSEDQAVASEGLQFQWTQVQRSNVGGSVEYVLVVVPILGSESPSVAIERNELLMQRREQRNSYLMAGADRPLVPIPLSMVSGSSADGTRPSIAEVFAADRSFDSITVHATTGADGATLVYMGRGAEQRHFGCIQ